MLSTAPGASPGCDRASSLCVALIFLQAPKCPMAHRSLGRRPTRPGTFPFMAPAPFPLPLQPVLATNALLCHVPDSAGLNSGHSHSCKVTEKNHCSAPLSAPSLLCSSISSTQKDFTLHHIHLPHQHIFVCFEAGGAVLGRNLMAAPNLMWLRWR